MVIPAGFSWDTWSIRHLLDLTGPGHKRRTVVNVVVTDYGPDDVKI